MTHEPTQRREWPRPAQLTLALLLGAGLLLTAALYNGYPLTFWDTRAYVEHAGTLAPRPDRLIGYSLLIRTLSFGATLWPVAIAQCLLTAALVHRVARGLLGGLSLPSFALFMALLSLGTALPWIAGQLMADIFTPLLVLSLWLVLEDDGLTPLKRTALLALVAASVAVHLTHLPLGLGLLASWLALARIGRDRWSFGRARAAVVALLVGLVAIAGFNYTRMGKLTLAWGSDTFLLGHLVDSGIASRVLDEHCPERGYLLCPYRDQLPLTVDELLWADKLDLKPWEHSAAMKTEAHRLLFDSLREHPLLHIEVALRYTLAVLARFRTGEGLDSDAAYLIEPQIARYAPLDLRAYRAAKQQSNALPVDTLRALHTPVGWALFAMALGCSLAFVRRGVRGLSQPSARFLFFVLTALLLNALISANLSGIYDRYQSRLMWLLALAVWPSYRTLRAHSDPAL